MMLEIVSLKSSPRHYQSVSLHHYSSQLLKLPQVIASAKTNHARGNHITFSVYYILMHGFNVNTGRR